MQPGRAVKSFLRTRLGFILLIALAIAVVVVTYTYVGGPLLAIVAMLIFGLGLPIWVGISRPRTLAIVGVVILVASAPLITFVETGAILTPTSAASSPASLPSGNGGAILQNATVSPFVAAAGSTFNWSVSVFPRYLPPQSTRALWLDLFISTCPGATGTGSPNCAAGYTFYLLNHTLPRGVQNGTIESFTDQLNGTNIWSWQMAIAYDNRTTGNLTWTFLVGDPTYNGIEGPITGNYWSTYVLLVGTIYEAVLFYLGLVFFIALLVYMVFKNRRRKRQDQNARANPPAPTDANPPDTAPPASPPTTPPALTPLAEAACPNCGAVVYPGEKVCWKCGTKLTPPPASGSAPLPSSPKG